MSPSPTGHGSWMRASTLAGRETGDVRISPGLNASLKFRGSPSRPRFVAFCAAGVKPDLLALGRGAWIETGEANGSRKNILPKIR
jgi:hypothetical protein